MKPYSRRVNIQAKTETNVKVGLAPKPSRSDAVIAYILAGAFTGGGIFLGLQANKYEDQLQNEIAAGNPPPDSRDPRYTKGKAFAIAADATFVIAGITALTAVYYTFRDKGPPRRVSSTCARIALTPQIGPGYAGVGMGIAGDPHTLAVRHRCCSRRVDDVAGCSWSKFDDLESRDVGSARSRSPTTIRPTGPSRAAQTAGHRRVAAGSRSFGSAQSLFNELDLRPERRGRPSR